MCLGDVGLRFFSKKRWEKYAASTHLTKKHSEQMIIECNVSIKEILEKGKAFPWIKLEECPCCADTVLWGHGFVLCYFSFISSGIYLKRYRCPNCKSVIKLKPAGFFNNFRTPVKLIKKCLKNRINKKKIINSTSRSLQDYWLRNLKKNVRAVLGEKWTDRLFEGFEELIAEGIVPVSCSICKI